MATDVTGPIDDVEAALDAGRFGDLPGLVEDLVDAYDRREPAERARAARARAIARRSAGATPPEVVAYLDRSGAVQLARASAATSLGTFAVQPSADRTDDVAEIVRELRTHEDAFETATREAAAALDAVALPPTVNVLRADLPPAPIPAGTTFSVESIVGNVGDEPADGVTLAVEATDREFGRSTASVGELEAGTRADAPVAFDAVEVGDLTLAVEVRADGATSDRRTVVGEILDRRGFVERAARRVVDLNGELAAAGLHHGLGNSLAKKLDAAAAKLEDAADHAAGGRPAEADDVIAAASGVLGAFSNQVEAKTRTDRIDVALGASLSAGTADVVGLLDAAREVDSGGD